MHFQTDVNSQSRTVVDLICRRMGLGSVPTGQYSSNGLPHISEKMTLREIARVAVENASGIEKSNWPAHYDVAARAMTTSDFSNILADVSNKQLAAAYAARPASFTKWASSGSAPNFKPLHISRLSAPGVLPEVLEDGEFKNIYMDDASEVVRIRTYGGILGLTRQTIINDDLDALRDSSRLLSQSAALTQTSLALQPLTGSAVMSDGLPLFSADRENLLSGSESVLSADSLAAGVAVMRRFKDTNGQPLSIEPKYLIVGPGNERLAYQLCYSNADPGTSNSGTVNFIKESVGLEVIVDPLLETSSLTAWYLLPDPAVTPVIRYYTLDGGDLAPYIESKQGFVRDSLEFKTRVDFGAGAISTFGVKSAGA